MTKRIVVALFMLCISAQLVRSAIVQMSSEPAIGTPASLWPSHPKVLADAAMRGVQAATAEERPLSAETQAKIRRLAVEDPLASEPFLALGMTAYLHSDARWSRSLLIEGRRRDARLPAIRYFLARLEIDEGRLGAAFNDAATLARLVPGTNTYLAPAFSSLMRETGGLDQARQVLESYPDLAPDVLNELAQNPENADLLIALAPAIRGGPRSSRWREILLQGLLERGQYEKAWFAWAKLTRHGGRQELIRDPGFREASSPPPFGWALADDGAMIDRTGGGLQVTYYGRKNVRLARQVLLLPPDSYELAMALNGEIADAQSLHWRLSCLPTNRRLAEMPIKDAANGVLHFFFQVPNGCEAQQLSLDGEPGDFARPSSFTLSGLQLTRLSKR